MTASEPRIGGIKTQVKVITYKGDKDAEHGIEKMLNQGWEIQDSDTRKQWASMHHGASLLVPGLALLTKKQKHTVTFVRRATPSGAATYVKAPPTHDPKTCVCADCVAKRLGKPTHTAQGSPGDAASLAASVEIVVHGKFWYEGVTSMWKQPDARMSLTAEGVVYDYPDGTSLIPYGDIAKVEGKPDGWTGSNVKLTLHNRKHVTLERLPEDEKPMIKPIVAAILAAKERVR